MERWAVSSLRRHPQERVLPVRRLWPAMVLRLPQAHLHSHWEWREFGAFGERERTVRRPYVVSIFMEALAYPSWQVLR